MVLKDLKVISMRFVLSVKSTVTTTTANTHAARYSIDSACGFPNVLRLCVDVVQRSFAKCTVVIIVVLVGGTHKQQQQQRCQSRARNALQPAHSLYILAFVIVCRFGVVSFCALSLHFGAARSRRMTIFILIW